jgi:hypothetical protein
MSRFGLAAALLTALATAACSSGNESPYGPMAAAAPADPVVSFAANACMTNSTTGHGLGMQRCVEHEEMVARAAGGGRYVAAYRAD